MLLYDSLRGSHKAIIIINIIKKYVCLELLSKQVYKEVPLLEILDLQHEGKVHTSQRLRLRYLCCHENMVSDEQLAHRYLGSTEKHVHV